MATPFDPEDDNVQELESFDYSRPSLEEEPFSSDPTTYLDIVNETNPETNKNAERAFFNFYEKPDIQKLIYDTINADRTGTVNLPEINSSNNNLFTICNEDSFLNKTSFAVKSRNEIICTAGKNTIQGFIEQMKVDWKRISDLRPLYSSKFNTFFSIKEKTYITKQEDNYSEFLTIVNSIFKYLLTEPQLQETVLEETDVARIDFMSEQLIKAELDIDDTLLGNVQCKCRLFSSESGKQLTRGCNTFTNLIKSGSVTEKVGNVLYKLLPWFQSADVTIVKAFIDYFDNVSNCKYDKIRKSTNVGIENFTYNDSYYYIDEKNKTLVTMFKLYLNITTPDRPMLIPIYNIIHVYPENVSQFSYMFLFIDNEAPSNVGVEGYFSGFDHYAFIEKKIKWYTSKPVTSFTGFNYIGEDLKAYEREQANQHRTIHAGLVVAKLGGQKANKVRKVTKIGKKSRKVSKKGKGKKPGKKSRKVSKKGKGKKLNK